MGQYYYIVNIDKKQFLHPHKFNEGLKLMEFGCDGCGILTALTVLLADGNGRGGGDLHCDDPLIGSWAGDRIVIAGDYADPGRFMEELGLTTEELQKIADNHFSPDYAKPEEVNLHAVAVDLFEDISERALLVICQDGYVARERGLQQIPSLRPDMQIISQGAGEAPKIVTEENINK